MDADDIANAVGDWEILEAPGVDYDGGVVIFSGLVTLLVEGGVDDFEGANILLLVDCVGESSIDNNTINVVVFSRSKRYFVEVNVFVLLRCSFSGSLGWGSCFLGCFGCHC